MPSLHQALVYGGEQDEIPATRSILLLTPCPHPLQNSHSAILLGSRIGHLEGKDVVERVEGEPRLPGWRGHWGGGGASSPSVLTILNQWEWKARRERAWLTPDPKAQAWKPALPCSVSWRLSSVREQKGYVQGVISWLTGQWG